MGCTDAQHKNLLCDSDAGPGLRRCDGYADRANHRLDDGNALDDARRNDNAARDELESNDRHFATAATTVPGQAQSENDNDTRAALTHGGAKCDSVAPMTTAITAPGAAARSDDGEAKPTTPGGTKAGRSADEN